MKSMFLALALFAALPAQAGVAADVCERQARDGLRTSAISCLRDIAGKTFDPRGVAVCQRIVDQGEYTTADQCLAAIANRQLSPLVDTCYTYANQGHTTYSLLCIEDSIVGDL